MKRNIFLTSDHHFGHSNILKFTNRLYDNIDDMQAAYIKRWNRKAKKGDIIYILGDHIWNTVSPKDHLALNNSLNGSKILVIGNHDKVNLGQALNLGYVAAVHEAKLRVGTHTILLSHYPYRFGFWKNLWTNLTSLVRFGNTSNKTKRLKYPIDNGLWLAHGHTHSPKKVNGRQIHIGVDAWNGELVALHQISDIIKKH